MPVEANTLPEGQANKRRRPKDQQHPPRRQQEGRGQGCHSPSAGEMAPSSATVMGEISNRV